jgi:Skp family chaperone for outer membrane proteins
MNRMFCALLVLAISCTAAAAQPAKSTVTSADRTVKAGAVGTTKVAVFNIGVVFTKYQRALDMKEEAAAEMKRFQGEAKELVENIKAWESARANRDLSQKKKDLYEEKIINAKRQLEDLDRHVRMQVGKSQEAKLTNLWKDVRAAVKTYAAEHDLQLVISYGDPMQAELVDAMPNINRKMQSMDAGSGVPFFVGPGVDISDALVEMLNRHYREKKGEQTEEDPQ